MTYENVAMMVLDAVRYLYVERLRRRADHYSGAAQAVADDAKRMDDFFARAMRAVSGAMSAAAGDPPPSTKAEEPSEATHDPRSVLPTPLVCLRAVGDCGQPHASVEDAFACVRDRRERGLPISEEDQRIMDSVKNALASPSSSPVPRDRRRTVRLVPAGRSIEPGPFATRGKDGSSDNDSSVSDERMGHVLIGINENEDAARDVVETTKRPEDDKDRSGS